MSEHLVANYPLTLLLKRTLFFVSYILRIKQLPLAGEVCNACISCGASGMKDQWLLSSRHIMDPR